MIEHNEVADVKRRVDLAGPLAKMKEELHFDGGNVDGKFSYNRVEIVAIKNG